MDIVLVEDDTTLADVIAMRLRAEGFRVRPAADGEAALDACATQRPDVVLLDVMLPKKTGLEVCAELRRLTARAPAW
jgi:DNA-binding response OmpR family regulator